VKHQLVVTLLAILELAKLRVIRVLQDPESELFYIAQRDGSSLDDARRARVTAEAAPGDGEQAADGEAEQAAEGEAEQVADGPAEQVQEDQQISEVPQVQEDDDGRQE
jgi:hypothetical protein